MNAISKALPSPDTLGRDGFAVHAAQVRSFAQNQVTNAKRGERRAWTVALLLGVAVVAEGVGMATIARRPAPAPQVFREDRATGFVDRVYDVDGGKMEASEAQQRFWLWHFVRHCETYVPQAHAHNLAVCTGLAAPNVQAELDERLNRPKDKDTLVGRLGRDGSAEVQWISTTFSPSQERVAVVRFSRAERRDGTPGPVRYFAATISWAYARGKFTGRDINANPDGFVVTSYTVAEEGR